MTEPRVAEPSRASGATVFANWTMTLLVNVALPLLTYFLLTGAGWSAVPALLVSGAWPAVETVLLVVVRRRIDEFGLLSLVFIALGVVAGVGFNSDRLVLVKESAVTGLFGIVVLGSLALPRPLTFYLGRKFATDGTAAGVEYWNGLWRYPKFRHTQRVVAVVWGVGFLAEALLQIALTYALSTSAMVVVSAVLPMVLVASLITWTVSYGRRARRAAIGASGAASGPLPDPTS